MAQNESDNLEKKLDLILDLVKYQYNLLRNEILTSIELKHKVVTGASVIPIALLVLGVLDIPDQGQMSLLLYLIPPAGILTLSLWLVEQTRMMRAGEFLYLIERQLQDILEETGIKTSPLQWEIYLREYRQKVEETISNENEKKISQDNQSCIIQRIRKPLKKYWELCVNFKDIIIYHLDNLSNIHYFSELVAVILIPSASASVSIFLIIFGSSQILPQSANIILSIFYIVMYSILLYMTYRVIRHTPPPYELSFSSMERKEVM